MSRGLALVQRVAGIREKLALRELATAVKDRQTAQVALDEVTDARDQWQQRMGAWVAGGTLAANLADGQTHIQALDARINDRQAVLVQQGEQLAERQGQWAETRQRRRAIDTVISRRETERLRQAERREQQLLHDQYRPNHMAGQADVAGPKGGNHR